jgi:hypothetical protein
MLNIALLFGMRQVTEAPVRMRVLPCFRGFPDFHNPGTFELFT